MATQQTFRFSLERGCWPFELIIRRGCGVHGDCKYFVSHVHNSRDTLYGVKALVPNSGDHSTRPAHLQSLLLRSKRSKLFSMEYKKHCNRSFVTLCKMPTPAALSHSLTLSLSLFIYMLCLWLRLPCTAVWFFAPSRFRARRPLKHNLVEHSASGFAIFFRWNTDAPPCRLTQIWGPPSANFVAQD